MRPENHKHIIGGLEQYWFPEQITRHYDMNLWTATIYRALENGLFPTVLQETLRQRGPAKRKGNNAEGRSRIAYPRVSGQPKQLPEVVQATGKVIRSLENGEPGA